MSEAFAPQKQAILGLERALLRRRVFQLDLRLRLELLFLFTLIAAFVFWRARVSLASLVHDRGPLAGASAVLALWAGLALLGGVLSGSHHALSLKRGPPGPPWLALPIPPRLLQRHLSWSSRLHVFWVAVPAVGIFVACIGLLPVWWLPLLAGTFIWLLLEASRLGCVIGYRVALFSTSPRPGLHPLLRVLAAGARSEPRAVRVREARWSKLPAWQAIVAKDLLLCLRPTRTRRRLFNSLVVGLLSVLAWSVPLRIFAPEHHRPDELLAATAFARFIAFGLALAAAATFGEFLISLCGEDPFPVVRSLPHGVGTLWTARAAWAMAFALALVVAHALAARSLERQAFELFLEWTGLAVFTIAILAIHYGLTLFPRAEAAQRLFALSLGLVLAASVMIPLMGWVVLLAGVVHSARRLSRWSRLEEAG